MPLNHPAIGETQLAYLACELCESCDSSLRWYRYDDAQRVFVLAGALHHCWTLRPASLTVGDHPEQDVITYTCFICFSFLYFLDLILYGALFCMTFPPNAV